MSVVRLTPEALSKAAFKPFGDVIEIEGAEQRVINEGFATRFHDLAKVEVGGEGGRPLISIFRAKERPKPLRLHMLERHPLGSQAFFPLGGHSWLVVVAEGGAAPDLATIRCFHALAHQGVNYAPGVWHFPLIVLVPEQEFLVVDRGGLGNNLEEHFFPATVDIIIGRPASEEP